MKIAVFNGSPRKENTQAMVEAFREGAESAGHEVEIYHVGQMKIGVLERADLNSNSAVSREQE